MADLEDLDLIAPADSLYSGGVKINLIRTRVDALYTILGDITTAEADQIEAIGTTTISAAQWAYLGALDQSIISTASVDFGEVDITKTTTLAAGGFGLRSQVTHSTTGMTGTLRGAYIVATNAPFTATGAIRGAEIKARAATSGDVGGNVTTLEGVSISCDAKNKTVTTQRGMEVILDGKSGAAVTLGVGIRIANNYQANIATTSYALQIYRDSFDYTADIQLSGGGLIGGSTGKIKMDSSGVTTLTASGNLDIGSYNFRAATLTADGLTSGRVVFASTSGLLTDDSDFTFATDTLTVTKIAAFTLMGKLTAGAVEIEGSAFDINGGTIDGITSLTAAGALDIGAYGFRAATLTADGLTATRVIFAGASGLLSDSAAMTFVTDTLTVTKLGAFQAAGAINFDSQNMTNVDIDSGTIGGVTLDGAIAGGDQAFTNVGDMTFAAASILKSGSTNTNTLLLAANDTTFITLTTGDTDTLGIGAFTLSGKLTAGAVEIEGSAFDINGGAIGGITFDGALTMTLGSDADGDVYYRASNVLTRLAKGTASKVLAMNAGATAPEWTAIAAKDADADTMIQVEESADEDKIRMDVGGNQAFLLSDIGVATYALQAGAHVGLITTDQTFPTTSALRIRFNDENFDTQNEFDSSEKSGTADATGASKLHDTDGGFASGDVGKVVYNTTDYSYTTVSGFVDSGELNLTDDTMTNGETYIIYSSRFTTTEAGKYLVSYGLELIGPAADKIVKAYIFVNGVFVSNVGAHTSHLSNIAFAGVDVLDLAPSDYVEIWVYHDCGAARDFKADYSSACFHKIA